MYHSLCMDNCRTQYRRKTVLFIFPPNLQTIIITQTLSIGGEWAWHCWHGVHLLTYLLTYMHVSIRTCTHTFCLEQLSFLITLSVAAGSPTVNFRDSWSGFYKAGRSFCYPTNSVKALRESRGKPSTCLILFRSTDRLPVGCLFLYTCSPTPFQFITLAASCGKRNATIQHPSFCSSNCSVGILTVTHQWAACNAASVHFGPTVRTTYILMFIGCMIH